MIEALSTPRNQQRSLVFFAISGLSAIASAAVGIVDNPPGVMLGFLAAAALILAFAHPWRTARQFGWLLLAAVLGLGLFVIFDILTASSLENPAAPAALKNLLQSRAYETLVSLVALLCPAAFLVGLVGALVMLLRNRRRRTG